MRVSQKKSKVESAETEETMGSVRVVSGSGFRYVVPFPWRLHQMLEAIDKAGDSSIVSWLPDGKHFQVHNSQAFVDRVIPKFFKQKSYKSFQRQLHLYGFQRETDGPNRGAYHHESFLRDDRQLSLEISRIKAPKRRRPTPQSQVGKNKVDFKATSTSGDPSTRFQPLKVNSNAPILGLTDHKALPLPVVTFENATTSSQPVARTPAHAGLLASAVGSTVESNAIDSSAAETYEWLISTGVPVSAFDPVSVNPTKSQAVDFHDCADEIASIFSCRSASPVVGPLSQKQGLDSPVGGGSFGLDVADASLSIPDAMLGELNAAIWGL